MAARISSKARAAAPGSGGPALRNVIWNVSAPSGSEAVIAQRQSPRSCAAGTARQRRARPPARPRPTTSAVRIRRESRPAVTRCCDGEPTALPEAAEPGDQRGRHRDADGERPPTDVSPISCARGSRPAAAGAAAAGRRPPGAGRATHRRGPSTGSPQARRERAASGSRPAPAAATARAARDAARATDSPAMLAQATSSTSAARRDRAARRSGASGR